MSEVYIKQDLKLDYEFSESMFDIDFFGEGASITKLKAGRGASYKLYINQRYFVLRKYLRGGFVARLFYDQYFWTGIDNTRCSVEWKITNYALEHNLPVAPVAAMKVERSGMCYRATLITFFIENIGTLAEILSTRHLKSENWFQLGILIKRFHDAGIIHADLNANNILVDDAMDYHLIDFDKAMIRKRAEKLKIKNLERLLRSLRKSQALQIKAGEDFNFKASDWDDFSSGYNA